MSKSYSYLTRTVVVLSFVSLLNDISSELLYPIMPVYLASIGYSYAWIGVLEGIAEATAGILKGYFGKLSDVRGIRSPFVKIGYSLSAFGRLILVFANSIGPVFISRIADRIGKGVRTAARDAMLASEADAIHMAKVYGFHRAMDTLGAVIGPALALCYLHFNPGNYKGVFVFAALPTLGAALLTLVLREKKKVSTLKVVGENANNSTRGERVKLFGFLSYWKTAPASYRKLVSALFVFTLINSSDVFLLLAVKKTGFSDMQMIMIYIFYNLCYALLSFPVGSLADRIGKYKVLIAGLTFFCITYGSMYYLLFNHITPTYFFLLAIFFIYALYASCTESVVKAIIASTIKDKERGTAMGFFTGVSSFFALLASTWTGIVWAHAGSANAFLISAIGVMIAGFMLVKKNS